MPYGFESRFEAEDLVEYSVVEGEMRPKNFSLNEELRLWPGVVLMVISAALRFV